MKKLILPLLVLNSITQLTQAQSNLNEVKPSIPATPIQQIEQYTKERQNAEKQETQEGSFWSKFKMQSYDGSELNMIGLGASGLNGFLGFKFADKNSPSTSGIDFQISANYARTLTKEIQIAQEFGLHVEKFNAPQEHADYKQVNLDYMAGALYNWGSSSLRDSYFAGLLIGLNQTRFSAPYTSNPKTETNFSWQVQAGKRYTLSKEIDWTPSIKFRKIANDYGSSDLSFNVLSIAVWF